MLGPISERAAESRDDGEEDSKRGGGNSIVGEVRARVAREHYVFC
jgi:hypothetical protein